MVARRADITDEVILGIFDSMRSGISLRQSCAEIGLSESTVRAHIAKSDELSAHYTRAREALHDVLIDNLNDVARDEIDVNRARLLCDNAKWAASKILPKKYGDRHILAGDPESPLTVSITALSSLPASELDALEQIARRLLPADPDLAPGGTE